MCQSPLRFRPFGETINQPLKCPIGINVQVLRQNSADGAVILLCVLKCVRINTVISTVHHVVVGFRNPKKRIGVRRNLESLVTAACCNYGICGRNGRNDVLHYTLSHGVSDPRDVELIGSFEGLLVQPGDMLRIISIQSIVLHSLSVAKPSERYEHPLTLAFLFPGNDMSPFNTMLRLPWNSCQSAQGDGGTRRIHVKLTLYASSHGWQDDLGLSLEP